LSNKVRGKQEAEIPGLNGCYWISSGMVKRYKSHFTEQKYNTIMCYCFCSRTLLG
jgi:hypothetical protein